MAQELAISGTSRHPVVGLLRSSQGSLITPADYDRLLRLLKPGNAHSFTKLRELAKGLSSAIDTREPWESGYQLARFVRERLGLSPSAYVDMEDVVRRMCIEIQDAACGDAAILGVCVGTPGYSPLVVLNSSCPDVTGVSGRRVTLAHELCHLLFDRAALRSLARFEGGGADSDRMIEMRANAFAVELLVPMATLVGDHGVVVDGARLQEIAVQQQVSSHALQWHAKNLRNRLSPRS
jgi:Zn-dependent peptidase ImmA (M78 family)